MKQRLPFTFVFAAFALFLLLGPLKPYLVETASLTPFYADEFTFGKLLGTHGGLLFQVAAGLQSCFARPWLGASLFVVVLAALAYVQRWAFRVGDRWFGLCWVSSFALLASYTQLGYLIYPLKQPAVAFAPALGALVAFALIGLWFRLKHWWCRVMFLLTVPLAGFWLFSFWGAFVAPFVGFVEVGRLHFNQTESTSSGQKHIGRQPFFANRASHLLWGLALFIVGLLLPSLLLFVLHRPLDVEVGHIPFDSLASSMRGPAAIALAVPLFYGIYHLQGKRQWMTAVAAVVFAASGIVVYTHSFLDSNFLNTLQMKHSAEAGDWNQVLKLARENEPEPTRAQVCLTRLALFKTGRMGDELFAYPDGSAAYNAPQQNQWLRLMIGPLLYYHYGKTGFAYRWAMEDLVEYGERPAYLRYLHGVARLNGEEALARRYERTLARTLFYKGVCAHEEAEATAIRPLMNFTDQLDGDNGMVEFYLLNSFALSEGGSRPMVELSLMNGLITKNLSGFWPRFLALLPTWQGHIPTHYQEAALMVAQLQGAPVGDLPIDPTIRQRFQQLVEASARMGDNAANASVLRPQFGNTYWYYYFFVDGLKTN